MPLFYQGSQVLITHRRFVRLVPPCQEFLIAELRDLSVVRGDLPPARVVTAHAAGGAIVIAIVVGPVLHSVAAWAAVGALVMVSVIGGGACWRMAPRTWELRGTYRGFEVTLFETADARTFGQVRRALLRAVEHLQGERYPFSDTPGGVATDRTMRLR